jgi:DivIVA domain-containing protein
MDRQEIARTDFTTTRRGYAREEVDQHLQAVAAEVARLEEDRARSGTLAGSTADRVREVIEAAERSASDIQSKAEQEAARSTERNEAQARAARESAEAELAEHVKRVEETLERTLERSTSLESEFERTAETLLAGMGRLVSDLRGSVKSIHAQLDDVRTSLPGEPVAAEASQEGEAPGREAQKAAETRKARTRGLGKDRRREESAKEQGAWAGPRSAPRAEAAEGATASKAGGTGSDDRSRHGSEGSGEGARMIALNMALKGTPREETARYLAGNFELEDPDAVVEEVYRKVRG